MEIRPSIEWNKGHALNYLLETLGLSNSSEVLPLYIGDDRTDEDAFKVTITSLMPQGIVLYMIIYLFTKFGCYMIWDAKKCVCIMH